MKKNSVVLITKGDFAVISSYYELTGWRFWIGEYDPHLTHQNGEPLYVWVDGLYDTKFDAEIALRDFLSQLQSSCCCLQGSCPE